MSLVIDCDTCTRQHTDTCADCVVSFFIDRPVSTGVVIDIAAFAAVKRLQRAGLVPELRHDQRVRAASLAE